MKRVLCLLGIILIVICIQGQDFASRFMKDFIKDTAIHCHTIGPKMMEKLVKIQNDRTSAEQDKIKATYFISKLKSARIITSTHHGDKYFKHAEKLMEKNKHRFTPLSETCGVQKNLIYVRRREETIVELIMLNLNEKESVFTAVNFTGDMDDEFIEMLAQNMSKRN